MKIFTNLTFLHLISHQLLWLPEKNWFQWCFLKKIWYKKFTSFFQNFHQIPIFECSGPPQTWKNPRKWLKNSFSSGHRFYLGCCKIWANSIELAFLADDPVSLDLAYCGCWLVRDLISRVLASSRFDFEGAGCFEIVLRWCWLSRDCNTRVLAISRL